MLYLPRVHVFFEHAEQLGYFLGICESKLRDALRERTDSGFYPQEALIYAIFLWGAGIGTSNYRSAQPEPRPELPNGKREQRKENIDDLNSAILTFLHAAERGLKETMTAIKNFGIPGRVQPSKVVMDESGSPKRHALQLVQASLLLATYRYVMGDKHSASMHVSSARYLANRIMQTRRISSASDDKHLRNIEEGENICMFWRVFELEMFTAALGVQKYHGRRSKLKHWVRHNKTFTPWPLTLPQYENVSQCFPRNQLCRC